MDLLDVDNVQEEKANAMLRYSRLRKITNLFRFVEICLALILLSWSSTRLPVVVKISGDYFRDLCILFGSPRFVFLVGNAIILTLFVKSSQFPCQNSTQTFSKSDLCDEFVKNSENPQKICTRCSPAAPEEIVCQDKQTVYEDCSLSHTYNDTVSDTETSKDTNAFRRKICMECSPAAPEDIVCQDKQTVYENCSLSVTYKDTVSDTDTNVFQTIPTEKLKHSVFEKPKRELRRSETEKCRKVDISGKKAEKVPYYEEEMSNEEFRRTIEAFIAKQMRFLREESMTIVPQNQS